MDLQKERPKQWLRAVQGFAAGRRLGDDESDFLLKVVSGFSAGLQLLACLHVEHGSDQGEQGNFWEPLHYLMYGTGIQNFEWSQEYAIRSPVFLVIFAPVLPLKFLPLPKSTVFFWVRYTVALMGCKSLHSMASAAKKPLGGSAAVLGLLLATFNHCIASAIGRLGVDSFCLILHCMCFAAWLRRRYVLLIWLCAITTYLKLSFAVVAVGMGLHILLLERPRSQSYLRWFFFLLQHALLAIVLCGALLLAADSAWYGRLTLSTLNFLHFNFVERGAGAYFGEMTLSLYADKLLLDNSAVISLAALLGLPFARQKLLFLPSLLSLLSLFLIGHKEYRFLFPLFPLLSLLAASGFPSLPPSLPPPSRLRSCCRLTKCCN